MDTAARETACIEIRRDAAEGAAIIFLYAYSDAICSLWRKEFLFSDYVGFAGVIGYIAGLLFLVRYVRKAPYQEWKAWTASEGLQAREWTWTVRQGLLQIMAALCAVAILLPYMIHPRHLGTAGGCASLGAYYLLIAGICFRLGMYQYIKDLADD